MEFIALAALALLLAGVSDLTCFFNERLVKLADGLQALSWIAVGGSAALALLTLA